MSSPFKDALCDAWLDYCPDNFDSLPKVEQDRIYKEFEEGFTNEQAMRAEMWGDR